MNNLQLVVEGKMTSSDQVGAVSGKLAGDSSDDNSVNARRIKALFGNKLFDVEHALNMYATSFVTMPAFGIYDDIILEQFREQIQTCHIYIIGTLPHIELVDSRVDACSFIASLNVASIKYEIKFPVPADAELIGSREGWFIKCSEGYWAPSQNEIVEKLNNEHNAINFDVLYIGQAYGKDGSRNALDRLKNHETLQKISLKGVPADQSLMLLMLQIEPDNRLVTFINPWADDKSYGEDRIAAGLHKLYETSEAEKIALYEACLIRYFEPHFNKEFKGSFPSTNLKILHDCYKKDISAIISEICMDELPFKLNSVKVKPSQYHIAKFDLHDDTARQVFFALDK